MSVTPKGSRQEVQTFSKPKGENFFRETNGNRDVAEKQKIAIPFTAVIPPSKKSRKRLVYQHGVTKDGVTTAYRLEGIEPSIKGARIEQMEVEVVKIAHTSPNGKFRLVIVCPVKKNDRQDSFARSIAKAKERGQEPGRLYGKKDGGIKIRGFFRPQNKGMNGLLLNKTFIAYLRPLHKEGEYLVMLEEVTEKKSV